jgi:hypothetical protein
VRCRSHSILISKLLVIKPNVGRETVVACCLGQELLDVLAKGCAARTCDRAHIISDSQASDYRTLHNFFFASPYRLFPIQHVLPVRLSDIALQTSHVRVTSKSQFALSVAVLSMKSTLGTQAHFCSTCGN